MDRVEKIIKSREAPFDKTVLWLNTEDFLLRAWKDYRWVTVSGSEEESYRRKEEDKRNTAEIKRVSAENIRQTNEKERSRIIPEIQNTVNVIQQSLTPITESKYNRLKESGLIDENSLYLIQED